MPLWTHFVSERDLLYAAAVSCLWELSRVSERNLNCLKKHNEEIPAIYQFVNGLNPQTESEHLINRIVLSSFFRPAASTAAKKRERFGLRD
jgi:hypothetical protein